MTVLVSTINFGQHFVKSIFQTPKIVQGKNSIPIDSTQKQNYLLELYKFQVQLILFSSIVRF